MRKTRTRLLNVLALENRLTPAATVSFTSGSLYITGDNAPNTVLLSGTAGAIKVHVVPGQNVRDSILGAGGNPAAFEVAQFNKGTYNVTGNIYVTMGNSADFVLVTLDDNGIIPGDLRVYLGNSADDLQIQTRTAPAAGVQNGTIQGRLTSNGGLGADNFFVFDTAIQGLVDITGAGTGFRPGSGGNLVPGDVFQISNTAIFNTVLTRDVVTLIDDGFGPNVIQGSLHVTAQTAQPLGNFQFISTATFPVGAVPGAPGTYSGLVALDAASVVTGSLTFSGSSANDGAYILGTVNGQVTAAMGAGANDFFLGQAAQFPGAFPTIGGGLNVVGGAGVDRVTLETGSTVNGAAQFTLFDGANLYDFDGTFTVNGGLTVSGGNSDDNVGNVNGTVNGNQTWRLGNGNNTLIWNGSGFGSGGRFEYLGGGGVDLLTINGTNAFQLYAYLYGGNDVFTYGAGASVASAYIDLGAGSDIYDDSLTVVTWPNTIIDS
jgi:hypothetical protein